MRYLRLLVRFYVIALARETAYRANFAARALASLLSLALAVATYGIIYRHTPEVAGWSQAEALLVLGLFRVAEGLIQLQVARNMWQVADLIRTGDLDYVLLRPVSSHFLATLQRVDLVEGVNVAIGLGLVIYAGRLAGVGWDVARIAAAGVFMLCGLILLYAFWCCCVTVAFWLQAGPLESVFFFFFDAGQYPVAYFKGWVRLVLTFIFPVAFASTFPAQGLLGTIDTRLLLVGLALAALALVGANRFWHFGLRHYSSASS